MDITKDNTNKNPRENANIFSILFFTYTFDMFKKGFRKILEMEDLYRPLNDDQSVILGDRLETKWNDHVAAMKKLGKNPSLIKVLLRTFWREYLILGVNAILMEPVMRLSQPLAMGKLLDFFRPDSELTKEDAILYAGVLIVLIFVNLVITNQYMVNTFHFGMKFRAACCSLIYRKALRINGTVLGETATGKVVNLLSNDVSRFDVSTFVLQYVYMAPLYGIFVIYFLWSRAGYAGLIGVIPSIIIVLLQSYTGKLSSKYRRKTAYKSDERIRLMDEIISGLDVIKMYAWEKPFSKLINRARQLELKEVKKISYIRGLYMAFSLFTSRVALFCSLITLSLTNQEITAANVFVFSVYYNGFSHVLSGIFIRAISETAEMLVSISRLQNFLLYDEYKQIKVQSNTNELEIAIGLHNVMSKWNLNSSDCTLSNINVKVKKGKLTSIIGPVGSGKSSLLQTILGELHIDDGSMEINGTLSYASQEAWVFASTIRQNIVFGLEYDKVRYNKVIQVCALEKDFKQFANGDLSIVGDKGISLSGGQKARINLARAIYRDADIYLLDDPLSAVDAAVAKHLYHKCINGFLRNKTRILITHQVHHLKNAENIIVINNGTIEEQGSFAQLENSGISYTKLLQQKEDQPDEENSTFSRHPSSRRRVISSFKKKTEDTLYEEDEDMIDIHVHELQEKSSKGKIKGSLFFKYLLSGGNICFVAFVLLLYLLSQASASCVDYFISVWVKAKENHTGAIENDIHNDTSNIFSENNITSDYFMYIYVTLIGSVLLFAVSRSLLFFKLAMSSSQKLHDRMFNGVMNTSMQFFNVNSSGMILNRFSKDTGQVDEMLPKTILDTAQILLMLIGSLVLVAAAQIYFLIPVFIVGSGFMLLRNAFIKISKNIKRLEGMTRSPVFTHLNSTIQGLTTIRAHKAQNILKLEFDKHQDLHSGAWFMYITTSSAFGFALDLLGFVLIATITFVFVFVLDGSTGGDVGLAITQALTLTGFSQWGFRQSAEVANHLISVERMLEYAQLPLEKQPEKPQKPQEDWPEQGTVSFKDASLRYSEDAPVVLKNLNFTIHPKEKIGIIGRTGAGKSSLISALFRLAIVEGDIEIDGIQTKDLNLKDLRSKLSIIPQDPILFAGTLRYNLDPFDEYSDEVLYKALNQVELKDPANIINHLNNKVMDHGANYSVGQRQLICLARAIIRNNRILILDEATANVDPQTDALIQKTIAEKFADCTVLTIAHRLNTIMSSDRVLVMDSGSVIEFDHPHLLLQDQKGVFYRLVEESGKDMGEQLRLVARENYELKYGVSQQ